VPQVRLGKEPLYGLDKGKVVPAVLFVQLLNDRLRSERHAAEAGYDVSRGERCKEISPSTEAATTITKES